ncbi:acetyl esterase/lipase [Microbacterium sp. ZKA21]|uniref:alpha/beta hydrolase n=1 Tax=Microbacterium sp. ZKA21 TaxID=3381694 RepID=UPI003D210BE1
MTAYRAQDRTERPAEREVTRLWPDGAAGDYGRYRAETCAVDSSLGWRDTTVIRNVFDPTITVIRPGDGGDHASLIVLPGGGFGGLAWQHEGTEVGEFLAGLGVTAFILKYRVQRPTWWRMVPFFLGRMKAGIEPAVEAASADAVRALRLVRANAKHYGIDPGKVGMMGFSAGAMTVLRVLQSAETESRPDFVASVYGFHWYRGVRPEHTPMLVAAAEPDRAVADAARLTQLWKEADAPVETHIFASGDHGFGLGRPGTDSVRFADVLANWLRSQGLLS